ncbi:CoA transferase [Gryllotalpicola koreensis]|uniref:CoA transferase n=1 Tax=Gryllotalpicola koreensis TaxID=993086 RepID=A0ABP7ZYG2_9MICO
MNALDGIRVLDFSSGVAAPIVGMFLADFGADVIKVEPPTGDPSRSKPGFAVFNRNKKSVVVDIDDGDDRQWLEASVRGADVVILGAGQELRDWGAEVEFAARRNQALITAKLPGFLAGTYPWGTDSESNGLLSAAGGQATRQSSYEGGPVDSPSSFILYDHGAWATTCVVAALVERENSGRGQTVTVGGMNGIEIGTIGTLTVNPNVPTPPTNLGPVGRHPTYRQFQTSDGWISSGALGAKFELRLLKALGLNELLDDPRIEGITQRMLLPENMPWVTETIEASFRARTTDELLEIFETIGIPAGRVRSRDEWLDDEQVKAIGMSVEVDDRERGKVLMPGVPIVLTRTPGQVRTGAPRLGQDTGIEPWPAKRTVSESEERFVAGPLKGMRVLNMGTFVAGPMAGFLLAELGADVIKVEPLTGDPFRPSAYTYNRGMRSIAIDLASPQGRDAFHALAKHADVVMDSMRPGVMTKLGIDFDALSQTNPQIVTTSLSGFGEGGPLTGKPLVDMVVQAISGMMSSQGGDDTPVANTMPINDVTTGALTVLMITLGYFNRLRTGVGQRCWNSLIGTATYLQSAELVRFDGRPEPCVGGRDFRGPHPLQRYHRAANGWIYLDASDLDEDEALARLRRIGVKTLDALAEWISELTCSQAAHTLQSAGLRAVKARDVTEVLRDPLLIEKDIIHFRNAADGSSFAVPGCYGQFSRTQRRGPLSPAGVGENSVEVLEAAGLDAEVIDELIADDVVRVGGKMVHTLGIAYR